MKISLSLLSLSLLVSAAACTGKDDKKSSAESEAEAVFNELTQNSVYISPTAAVVETSDPTNNMSALYIENTSYAPVWKQNPDAESGKLEMTVDARLYDSACDVIVNAVFDGGEDQSSEPMLFFGDERPGLGTNCSAVGGNPGIITFNLNKKPKVMNSAVLTGKFTAIGEVQTSPKISVKYDRQEDGSFKITIKSVNSIQIQPQALFFDLYFTVVNRLAHTSTASYIRYPVEGRISDFQILSGGNHVSYTITPNKSDLDAQVDFKLGAPKITNLRIAE